LNRNLGAIGRHNAPKPHQRSVSNRVKNVAINSHSGSPGVTFFSQWIFDYTTGGSMRVKTAPVVESIRTVKNAQPPNRFGTSSRAGIAMG